MTAPSIWSSHFCPTRDINLVSILAIVQGLTNPIILCSVGWLDCWYALDLALNLRLPILTESAGHLQAHLLLSSTNSHQEFHPSWWIGIVSPLYSHYPLFFQTSSVNVLWWMMWTPCFAIKTISSWSLHPNKADHHKCWWEIPAIILPLDLAQKVSCFPQVMLSRVTS